MKATITRTLQAPQYAPITMTLEEECTPEAFTATLNKLADLVENTLRERYPQYAGVLPKVEKKVTAQEQLMREASIAPRSHGEAIRKIIASDKVINIQRGAALVECIKNCTSFQQLKQYEKDLDSTEAEDAFNKKFEQLESKVLSTYVFPLDK